MLGSMHRDGKGGPEDFAEARRLLGLAAAQGDPYGRSLTNPNPNPHLHPNPNPNPNPNPIGEARAQTMLGTMHRNGEGEPGDFAEARRLFGLAATQGDP